MPHRAIENAHVDDPSVSFVASYGILVLHPGGALASTRYEHTNRSDEALKRRMASRWYKGAFNKYLFYTANTMVIEPTFWYM
jgi:hypothetical protein